MSAFDTAWALLKAPFHGTTEDKIEGGRFFGGIKRQGIKPPKGGSAYFTDSPTIAADYAGVRAQQQNSRPVMIHFPEDDVPKDSMREPVYRTTGKTIPQSNFTYNYGPLRQQNMTDEQYKQQLSNWSKQMENQYGGEWAREARS